MRFDYKSYAKMIRLLQECDYNIVDYHTCDDYQQVAILRHDVDNDLDKALKLAKLENSLEVRSTYFLLLSSNFYNLFSKSSQSIVNQIMDMGHAVGLHFDETKYSIKDRNDFVKYVYYEFEFFEKMIPGADLSISMHRPSEIELKGDFAFGQIVNTYSKKFFKEYKYLSDSRMNWREDVLQVIRSCVFEKLHILSHPFWYNETQITASEALKNYLADGNARMFRELSLNIRNLEEFLPDKPSNLYKEKEE